ncbi:hypothetical protein OJF2_43840 [Aquisphaera giovannonii]|uniref:Serine protease n=1 Tax=Aquisphaera giovannonii TaxID=406548 RepID=A0A5B9W668_9BACT|nr:effector-associated domain EAD1-containing protein [Aquisphaera giovannonii]QEH35827.1 hypothetical protein OJF2_43840 [Aquisphaera giovannonii]
MPDDRDQLREAALLVRAAEPGADALSAQGGPDASTLEALVIRQGRPVLAVEDDDIVGDVGDVWRARLDAAGVRDGLRRVLPAVGRIEVDNHPQLPYVGTGWLIADDVVVTAGFVAREFAESGGHGFVFRPGSPNPLNLMAARIDFRREGRSGNPRPFAVREVLDISGESQTQLAFLRLEPLGPYGPLSPPLNLAGQPPEVGRDVAVVGYPAIDSRMDQGVMRAVFGDVFEVKRVAVGRITGVEGSTLRHDCTTTGGTGGAPIVDLATGEVIGLHLGGQQFGNKFGVTAATIAARLEAIRRAATGVAAAASGPTAAAPDSNPRAMVAPAAPAPAPPVVAPPAVAPPPADQLVTALHGAFGFDALVRLAATELGVDLNALSPAGSTGDAIRALVQWAQGNGRIGDLFAAASALRPNNPQLAARRVVRPAGPRGNNVIRRELRELLKDQFPKRTDLAMLLDDAIGWNLDDIPGQDGGMEAVCFELVQRLWLNRDEHLRLVLELAIERRPTSIGFRNLLDEIFESSPVASGPAA